MLTCRILFRLHDDNGSCSYADLNVHDLEGEPISISRWGKKGEEMSPIPSASRRRLSTPRLSPPVTALELAAKFLPTISISSGEKVMEVEADQNNQHVFKGHKSMVKSLSNYIAPFNRIYQRALELSNHVTCLARSGPGGQTTIILRCHHLGTKQTCQSKKYLKNYSGGGSHTSEAQRRFPH